MQLAAVGFPRHSLTDQTSQDKPIASTKEVSTQSNHHNIDIPVLSDATAAGKELYT